MDFTGFNLTNWGISSSTPTGSYNVCAIVDPDNIIAETDEYDKIIRGDETFFVGLEGPTDPCP